LNIDERAGQSLHKDVATYLLVATISLNTLYAIWEKMRYYVAYMNHLITIQKWVAGHWANLKVLANQQVAASTYSGPSDQPDFLLLVRENIDGLLWWGGAAGMIILSVFLVSITRKIEAFTEPLLHRIKKFAPFIMQITLGATLLLSAYHGAIFGVELPLEDIFGSWAIIAQWWMYVAGVMLLLGIFPRAAGFGVLLLFIPILLVQEWQTVHHAIYLGEGLTILLFGGSYELVHSPLESVVRLERTLRLHLHKYKFVLLRIAFGLSVIYASFYRRFIFNDDLLQIISQQGLVADPSFLLLLILLVEIGIGIFFIIGFEIRFAAIIYAALLIISMVVFGEAIWSHITLIGTSLAMFTHGYDRYTLGGQLFERGNLEPIL
jgi:uncharacterized membrane protein YphA (DoxX/SURF4 family)